MTNEQRVVLVREFIVEDDRDHACFAVCKCDTTGCPALLKRFDLCFDLRAVHGIHRCEQRTEFGGAVPAERVRIGGNGFQISKEGILALYLRLVGSSCYPFTEQTKCRDTAVIAGKTAVCYRPFILHLIGIILGVGRRGALEAIGQPLALDTGVKLFHPIHQSGDAEFFDSRIREKL